MNRWNFFSGSSPPTVSPPHSSIENESLSSKILNSFSSVFSSSQLQGSLSISLNTFPYYSSSKDSSNNFLEFVFSDKTIESLAQTISDKILNENNKKEDFEEFEQHQIEKENQQNLINSFVNLGYSPNQCINALEIRQNNIENSTEYLLESEPDLKTKSMFVLQIK